MKAQQMLIIPRDHKDLGVTENPGTEGFAAKRERHNEKQRLEAKAWPMQMGSEALNYKQRDWDKLAEEWVDFSTLDVLNASYCAPPGSDWVKPNDL